jgi:hypothetical protein
VKILGSVFQLISTLFCKPLKNCSFEVNCLFCRQYLPDSTIPWRTGDTGRCGFLFYARSRALILILSMVEIRQFFTWYSFPKNICRTRANILVQLLRFLYWHLVLPFKGIVSRKNKLFFPRWSHIKLDVFEFDCSWLDTIRRNLSHE